MTVNIINIIHLHARLVTNVGIKQTREGWQCGEGSLVISLLCVAKYCLVVKWLLGALPRVAKHVAKVCHGRTAGLSMCPGSLLGVTVYLISFQMEVSVGGAIASTCNGRCDTRCPSMSRSRCPGSNRFLLLKTT
ncbi:hypothetical protein TNCV_4232311 [Trichonephila clavipes]|nr:hypothetical protein TNCV_4232311 [Trichonephila clavipes]